MKNRLFLSLMVGALLSLPVSWKAEATEAPSWRTYTTRAREQAAAEEQARQEAVKNAEEARRKAAAEAAAQPLWRRYVTHHKEAAPGAADAAAEAKPAAPAAQKTQPAVPAAVPAEKPMSALEKFRARANAETKAAPSEAKAKEPAAPAVPAAVPAEKTMSALEKFRARANAETKAAPAEAKAKETAASPVPAAAPAEKPVSALEKFRARANAGANTAAKPAAPAPSDSLQSEPLPAIPEEGKASWEMAASNSRYEVYFDSASLEYDEKTGIITVWNRWTRRGGTTDIYLYSRYDVRLRTFEDMYRAEYDRRLRKVVSEGAVRDGAWIALSPHTLGMELCTSLNTYLLNR